MKKRYLIIALALMTLPLIGKTIAEKKALGLPKKTDLSEELQKELSSTNAELDEKQQKLRELYARATHLFDKGVNDSEWKELLAEINQIRDSLKQVEESWRGTSIEGRGKEGYALWHQPDTTVGQLIIDYGSHDYVYLFTPDIAQIKISVSSNIPIPSSSWKELLDLILTQNGIGIKQINPFLRQLYLTKEDRSKLQLITAKRSDLLLLPVSSRVAFSISPDPLESKRVWTFLEKFAGTGSTSLQQVGRDIFIVGRVDEIQDLLKLYDFAATGISDKEYKVISLHRVDADEMAKVLSAIFDHHKMAHREAPPISPKAKKSPEKPMQERHEESSLRIMTLTHVAKALFLVGTREEIKKAEEIVRDVEIQVGGAQEKIIWWYTARHSNPEDLADVLSKIYVLMCKTCPKDQGEDNCPIQDMERAAMNLRKESCKMTGLLEPFPPRNIFDNGYYLDDSLVVDDAKSCSLDRDPNEGRNNFIVDPKSNAIVMVVEEELLPRMKELIKRLDVPKKMVQLEVLLFEKRLRKRNDFGLNLLKIGSLASNTHTSSALWNDKPENRGVFEYLLSRKRTCSGFPAFDLIYKFLMTQDDITINATPSVITMNQTLAKIAIEEEISVNTGIFEIPTTGAVALKDAYARARYGIKIDITPTIHMPEENDEWTEMPYVTLETDVVFETIHKGDDRNRPDVTRRVINNQVRIPNGQTVILGGLRRKVVDDKKESIPFVGELPGIGKLFSMTEMEDHSTEMYIFITPTIVTDPEEELIRIRTRELCRRPGDIPAFLSRLVWAREREKERMMTGAMDMLFGREPERVEIHSGEYDGRCVRS